VISPSQSIQTLKKLSPATATRWPNKRSISYMRLPRSSHSNECYSIFSSTSAANITEPSKMLLATPQRSTPANLSLSENKSRLDAVHHRPSYQSVPVAHTVSLKLFDPAHTNSNASPSDKAMADPADSTTKAVPEWKSYPRRSSSTKGLPSCHLHPRPLFPPA
jgi:hypothetical protein